MTYLNAAPSLIYCNKYVAMELYLSNLEENHVKLEVPKDKFNNLTNSERKALNDLKSD